MDDSVRIGTVGRTSYPSGQIAPELDLEQREAGCAEAVDAWVGRDDLPVAADTLASDHSASLQWRAGYPRCRRTVLGEYRVPDLGWAEIGAAPCHTWGCFSRATERHSSAAVAGRSPSPSTSSGASLKLKGAADAALSSMCLVCTLQWPHMSPAGAFCRADDGVGRKPRRSARHQLLTRRRKLRGWG